jgi:uncharacterized protein YqjF (DUF2071 family)
MDRTAPTRRPAGRAVQYQRWQTLLFLHWEVPVSLLRPLIPSSLEIDTFEGSAFVGLVPFTMRDVRPFWSPPVAGISNFHETNVRTYVHLQGRDPGVWFFSLDAASAVAVLIARTLWKLPYHLARMSLKQRADGSLESNTKRLFPRPLPGEARILYRPSGACEPARPGSLEYFLAERYVLYTEVRPDEMLVGRVHHPPYPLQPAELFECDENLLSAAGIQRPCHAPLVHFSPGVNVEIFPLTGIAP